MTDTPARDTLARMLSRRHPVDVDKALNDYRDEVLASAAEYLRTSDMDAAADVIDPSVDVAGFVRFRKENA